MSRIFISYSRQDQLFARRLATDLEALGANIWLDVDDIPVGMKWSSAIQQGLDETQAMLVIISPYSMSSKNVEDEWQYFLDHNKPIVPVYLATGRMHFQLSRLQYIDFRTSAYEKALRELYDELRKLGLKLQPFSLDRLSKADGLVFSQPDPSPIAQSIAQPKVPVQERSNVLSRVASLVIVLLLLIGVLFVGARFLTPATLTPTSVALSTQQSTPDANLQAVALVAATTEATMQATTQATTQATATLPPIPTDTPAATQAATSSEISAGTVRTDKNGIEQVWVPSGCFTMGTDPKTDIYSNPDETPAHQVCLTKGFWIDRYEVSNAAYQKFIAAGGYKDPQYWSPDGIDWLNANKPTGPLSFINFSDPDQPIVGITWYEADAYARWRGGHLPTEAQWEYAARGKQSLIYAWGNDWDITKANLKGTGINHTIAITSYPEITSWAGLVNVTGNVREWTSDWYDANYYLQQVKNDPAGPGSGTMRVARGGAWTVAPNSPADAARAQSRSAFRLNIYPYKAFNTVGVRVVTDSNN